jgi:metallo-beta-lactamase family protein
MRLTFCGAAKEVTGSCLMIEAAGAKVLVDCGLFQGNGDTHERNAAPFPFKPRELDAVILTHAHIDHIGRFPKLVKEGFSGRAFVTRPTRLLNKLMWHDAAHVMKDDARRGGRRPLYGAQEVVAAFGCLHGVEYGTKVRIRPGFDFRLREAGHIFGSAFVEIEADGRRLVCSGDIGNDHVPILRPTESISVRADALVLESTYGDRHHENPEERVRRLQSAVIEAESAGGTLLIPAFSLERTQEILYELNGLVESGEVPRLPIFLDSPLAIKVLPVYHEFPQYYNTEAKELSERDDFFDFPGLEITRRPEDSRRIALVSGPKVIIAGSGMMHGGRIMGHLAKHLGSPRNIVLVVGYQAAGTVGRKVTEGAETVMIDHEEIKVKAKVEIIGAYSAHGDQDKMVRWAMSGPSAPKRIFLAHGEPPGMAALAERFKEKKIIATPAEFARPVEI